MSSKAAQTANVNAGGKETQNENGCLRSSQRLIIKEMLNFNKPFAKSGGNGTTSSIWKVLIMDSCAQSILAPIISVNELRGEGVTLYLPLASGSHAQRDPIPEVPAIYLVEASKQNIELIIKDIRSGLYLKYYINFIGTITRSLLESFAQALIGADSRGGGGGGGASHSCKVSFAPQVQSIFDQYISFICLDRSLWILPTPSNGAPATMEYSVLCIFSSILAMSWLPSGGNDGGRTELLTATPPLILYPKGMEEMAQLLTEKIKGHLVNTKYTPNTPLNKSARPVIVLQQRGFDLSAPLLMPMTYHSLVDDLLGNHLNRVEFAASDGGATKIMDLDYSDPLWKEWGPLAFPDVAAKVDLALSAYKEDMSKVMKGGGAAGGDPSLDSDMTPEQLRTAVTRLPELAERKKLIDNHLQLCTLILDLIKKGGLGDVFPFIGQGGIMAPSGTMVHLENQAGRERFFSLLGPNSPCAFGNRLRLFSLAWICLPIHSSNMSNSSVSLLNNVEKWLEDSCVCALRSGCPDSMVDEFESTIKNLKSHRGSLKRAAVAEKGVYAVSPSAEHQSYHSPDLGAAPSATSTPPPPLQSPQPPLHNSGGHSASNPNYRVPPNPSDQTTKGNVIRGALFQGVKSLMATVGDSVAMGGVFGGAWGGGSTWNNGLTDDDVVGMGRSLPILRYLQQSLSRWRSPAKSYQHHQHNNNLSVIDCTGKEQGDQEEELDSDCLPPAILLYMDGGVTWGEWDQLQQWSQHQLGKVQQKFGSTKISGSTDRHQWLTLGGSKMLRGSTFLKEYFE